MSAPQRDVTSGPVGSVFAGSQGAAHFSPPDGGARLMARRPTGSIRTRDNRDGTVTRELRFSAHGEREELDALRAHGAIIRDRRGSPRRGLGPRKLNQAIR